MLMLFLSKETVIRKRWPLAPAPRGQSLRGQSVLLTPRSWELPPALFTGVFRTLRTLHMSVNLMDELQPPVFLLS